MSSPKIHSERSFGLLFTAVFAVIGIYGLYKGWTPGATVPWFVAGLLLALIAFVSPKLLAPFNRAWFLLGLLLNKIVSPIVLGIIFYGLLTPIAVLGRLSGRQALLLKPRSVSSYWVERSPPGPASDSFKNQY
ncbi:MAG: SxtJ family membrane protein [Nitrospiraceae bacterium]